MAIQVWIMPSAERDLKGLDAVVARRIGGKLALIERGGRLTGDAKRLTGRPARYRLRVGDYRVLFTLEERTMRVYRVAHRREVYE